MFVKGPYSMNLTSCLQCDFFMCRFHSFHSILPFKGQLVMEEFMGANVAMQTFTGRDKEA